MDSQEFMMFLAGLSIAGLLAGTSLLAGACATDGKSS
jgi:radical SAM modification target selenobiotic family peptide